MNFFIFFFGVILLFLIIDLLQKKVLTSISWSRKATHILSGVVTIILPSYLNKWEIVALSASFIVILYISRVKNILSLHKIARLTWGEIYYPLSILIIAAISLPIDVKSFYAGVLCLAFSDAIAALVGKLLPIINFNFGRHQKSLGGSVSFFISTFIILSVLFLPHGANVFIIIAVSVVISLSELFTFYGIDNLVVPVLTSVLSMWLL